VEGGLTGIALVWWHLDVPASMSLTPNARGMQVGAFPSCCVFCRNLVAQP
jgi:hypothetical protein